MRPANARMYNEVLHVHFGCMYAIACTATCITTDIVQNILLQTEMATSEM